jgi:hypothetical protein
MTIPPTENAEGKGPASLNPMDRLAKGAAFSLAAGFVGLVLGGPVGGALGVAAGALANVAFGDATLEIAKKVSHQIASHAKQRHKD